MSGRDKTRNARSRTGLADTLTCDVVSVDDAATVLDPICQLLVTALPVAAAAVVLVDERLNPVMAAASPADMRTMVAAQFERGEGPCVEACRTGESILETDVTTTRSRHWAAADSWRAVHTLPVRIDGHTAGVVSLASARDGGLEPAETATAHGISAIAAGHAATMRELRGSEQLADQLQRALHNRVEIEQAKGIVAQRLSVTVDEALGTLRHHASSQRRPVAGVARQVVSGRLRLRRREDDEAIRARPSWPPRPLLVDETQEPGRARLIGEADLSTADQLAQALARLDGQPGDMTLDLAELTFIDAHSIGMLVRIATTFPPSRDLVLLHATGSVAKALTLLDVGGHRRIRIM